MPLVAATTPIADLTSSDLSSRDRDNHFADAYWLRPHVHVCATQDAVVLLDLIADKYYAVPTACAEALAGVVHGWPVPLFENRQKGHLCATDPHETAKRFVQMGLLTAHPWLGKSATPVSLTTATTLTSIGRDISYASKATPIDVANFVKARCRAYLDLRRGSLYRAVQRVTSRKATVQLAQELDPTRTAAVVNVFRILRAYAFTAKGNCLMHALTLIHFLAFYNIYPMWILGVRTTPFLAHSWVQHKHYIIDSTSEDVSDYTPILAV